MRFLVRMWAIQPIPLKANELAALAHKQLAYWERLEKAGKVIFTAPYVGRRARVAIYDVDSMEEAFDLINEDPLFAYLDREVVPLGTNEQIQKLYARMLDQE